LPSPDHCRRFRGWRALKTLNAICLILKTGKHGTVRLEKDQHAPLASHSQDW
jgi:hypothetical protein